MSDRTPVTDPPPKKLSTWSRVTAGIITAALALVVISFGVYLLLLLTRLIINVISSI